MSYQDDDSGCGASCDEDEESDDLSEDEEDEDADVEDVEDVQEEGGKGAIEAEEESYSYGSYHDSVDREGAYAAYHGMEEDEIGAYHGDSDYYNPSSNEDGDYIGIGEGYIFGQLKVLALTFHTGQYDYYIEHALSSDSSATAHAGDVQDIRPANWEERRAISKESLKLQLQEYTRVVGGRCTIADVGVLSCFRLTSRSTPRTLENQIQRRTIEEEHIVPHDPYIDSYWQELFTAIVNATNENISKISSICIEKVEMKGEIVSALVNSLCGKAVNSITSIKFVDTNLGGEGVISLSTLMEQSTGLWTLNLSHNRIGDMNSALCLSRALKPHLSMDFLIMSHCDLGNDPDILSVILQSDVKHIVLSHNNIDSLGAVKISEYLEGNPPVKFLTLDDNDFNDDDAIFISGALKKNTNLSRLYIRRNHFTPVGVKTLFASLFDVTSLNTISESNHVCKLHVSNSHANLETLSTPFNQDYSPANVETLFSAFNQDLDRYSKILLALHDKESFFKYLTDVPVELMPDVLVFLQRKMNNDLFGGGTRGSERVRTQSMNKVYSAMRWWNMPLLYSFHRCVSSGTKRKRGAVGKRVELSLDVTSEVTGKVG
jgi:hypothetical protein